MRPLFSVAICTRNRAALLDGLLRTLSEQELPRDQFEVLVVDNNSTDATKAVVADHARDWRELRYLPEARVGLSHARNRAWREACGYYLAYTDDDCEVPPGWLEVAAEVATDLTPGVFGGPILALLKSPPPEWFKESYHSQEPFSEARILDRSEYGVLFGGNLFIRRGLFDQVGGFDPALGMLGKKMAFGEETAFLQKVADASDAEAYYDPRIWVRHLVRAEKLSLWFEARRAFAGGRSAYRLRTATEDPAPIRLRSFFRTLAGIPLDLLRGLIVRDREMYPWFGNYFVENTCRRILRLGRLYEQLRAR